MTDHPSRLDTDGDAIADRNEAGAGEPSRPASTGMMAGLDALPALLTVAEAAEVLRVGRSWVYEHAAEIGAIKLGPGQTAPLRIPREGVWRIVGEPAARRERRWVPSRRARKAGTSNGDLRARPRM